MIVFVVAIRRIVRIIAIQHQNPSRERFRACRRSLSFASFKTDAAPVELDLLILFFLYQMDRDQSESSLAVVDSRLKLRFWQKRSDLPVPHQQTGAYHLSDRRRQQNHSHQMCRRRNS
jgi:hypothetical protein